mgnify:FL=1
MSRPVFANDQERLEWFLEGARDATERQELLECATIPGKCDTEFCPWAMMQENLCSRTHKHHRNCKCADCCAADNATDDSE